MRLLFVIIYNAAALATFVHLMWVETAPTSWWQWIYLSLVNAYLSGLWPIFWLILRPAFGFP